MQSNSILTLYIVFETPCTLQWLLTTLTTPNPASIPLCKENYTAHVLSNKQSIQAGSATMSCSFAVKPITFCAKWFLSMTPGATFSASHISTVLSSEPSQALASWTGIKSGQCGTSPKVNYEQARYCGYQCLRNPSQQFWIAQGREDGRNSSLKSAKK